MIGFWRFFLENRAFSYFLVFLTLVAGTYAVLTIPKESTPEITIPVAVVTTPFFGASAADVEQLVTDKIENAIDNISDIKEYTSTSQAGFSSIAVEFGQNVDIDERVTRLKEAVDGVKGELPADGNDPVVTKVEFSEQPVLSFSLVSNIPAYSFQQVVDELEERINKINGVAKFNYSGIPEREIAVIVDNRKLIEKNLGFMSVVQSLSGSNVTLPVGSLKIGSVEYPLDLGAEVSSAQDLPIMPIASAGAGSLVVSDVAETFNGYKAKDTITRVGFPGADVQGAVNINVSKKDGGDITKITREIRDTLDELKASTLDGVDYVVTYDAGKDIQQDLSDLTTSGMQTVLLVFLILLVFVGFRESVIAAISIPFSFMLAFVLFIFIGSTINFISLFSLILSIGILVDTAIVVVEGINKKIQEGRRRQDAAIDTIREFGLPLIAGTMTTVAVFFPLLFLSGIIGQFIAGIPKTVILVLLSSLFVSLAYVTVFCATFLKNRDNIKNDRFMTRMFNRAEAGYENFIHYLLHHAIPRRLFQVGIIVAFFMSLGLIVGGLVKVEFFPGGDLEFAYIEIELAPGSPLSDTSEYAESIERIIETKPYIESFVTTVGQTSQFANEIQVGDQFGNIVLNIARESQAQGPGLVEPLRTELGDAGLLNDAELKVEAGGPPTGAPIDMSISSEDTDLLRDYVRSVEVTLATVPGTINVATSLAGNNSGFDILLDRNAAYRFGVDVSTIANTIRGATDGIELFDITENGEDVTVVVKNQLSFLSEDPTETKQITPEMIKQLTVTNNRGGSILLGSIIDIAISEADTEISHRDGKRELSVTSEIQEGFNANEVRAQFEEKLAEITPEGVSYSFGGEASEQDQSFAEVGIAFIVGVFLMFSILILQFGHWRQTVIILSVLPFALAGVLIGLFASNNALSFPAVLGLIALAGIVVNNSIILVTVFNQLRKENPEWDLEQVVARGAASRLRPVVLTTITTIIGVTPLLTASAIWSPIAYAIIFGLSFCIFVTLILIPLIYRRFEGFREGTWKEVGSFYLNILILLLVPVSLAIAAFAGAKTITGDIALAVVVGIIIIAILVYVATHIRKHK